MKNVLKLFAVSVALLFLLGAMLTTVAELFGGSKMRPLFGMSAEALAGPLDAGAVQNKPNANAPNAPNKPSNANTANDSDLLLDEPTRFSASKSGIVPLPRRAKDGGAPPTFFPASKSLGGEGLPGLQKAPQPQAPQPSPAQSPQQQQR